MSCNTCKKSTKKETIKEKNVESKINLFVKIRNYTIKIFAFLFLSIIFIPLVVPATIYALFVTIFTEKGVNLVPLGLYIGKKIFKEDDEELDEDSDEEFDEEFNENEYELENPNDISIIK